MHILTTRYTKSGEYGLTVKVELFGVEVQAHKARQDFLDKYHRNKRQGDHVKRVTAQTGRSAIDVVLEYEERMASVTDVPTLIPLEGVTVAEIEYYE